MIVISQGKVGEMDIGWHKLIFLEVNKYYDEVGCDK